MDQVAESYDKGNAKARISNTKNISMCSNNAKWQLQFSMKMSNLGKTICFQA